MSIEHADRRSLCADELENTGTFVQDERADDVGVEGSMPLRKNRPTLVVDHDSALAMQVSVLCAKHQRMWAIFCASSD